MGRTHVLHIRDSGGIFGGERAILTLARNIDPELFDLTLLCMRRGDGMSDPFISMTRDMGIRVQGLDVRGRLDAAAARRLRDFIRAGDVSIIHTHDFKSNFYGVWATANTGVKRVATAHGSTRDSLAKKAYLFFDERLVYRFFHRIIAVSHDLHDRLAALTGAGKKLTVIPNGLDPELLGLSSGSGDAALDLPFKSGAKTFSVVGRLFRDKGQAVFIRAFSLIADEFPDAAAIIAGDGPDRESLEALISLLGLKKRVHCCGVRKDIRTVYEATDFLVIPSFTEGLPYVLLEAMALGIPVLATSVGDIPKIIRDGATGCLVSPGDARAMADRMKDLMKKPAMAMAMAQAGKQFVDETCSARVMARRTEDLYRSLVTHSP